MDAWTIYWITRLDDIRSIFGLDEAILICIVIFLLASAGFCGWGLSTNASDKETWEFAKKFFRPYIKISIPILIVGLLFSTVTPFIPTSKDVIAIYALPKIANNEQIQEIGTNGMEYINEQLKAWIDDVKGKETDSK